MKEKELFEEMKNLALMMKKHADNELGKCDKNDLLKRYQGLNYEEKQEKSLRDDLELQNFYLAIKLNFFRVDE